MDKREDNKKLEFNDFLLGIEKNEKNLIVCLHKIQDLFGYISKDNMIKLSERFNMSLSTIYGTATFYSHFKTNKIGKNIISVCTGTACFVKGAEKILDSIKKNLNIEIGETTSDELFTLEDVRCVGACGLAPVISINGKIYGNVKLEDIELILDKYRPGGEFYDN